MSLVELFGQKQSVIFGSLGNAFEEGELEKSSMHKMHITNSDVFATIAIAQSVAVSASGGTWTDAVIYALSLESECITFFKLSGRDLSIEIQFAKI